MRKAFWDYSWVSSSESWTLTAFAHSGGLPRDPQPKQTNCSALPYQPQILYLCNKPLSSTGSALLLGSSAKEKQHTPLWEQECACADPDTSEEAHESNIPPLAWVRQG